MHGYDYAQASTQGARDYQEDSAQVWQGGGFKPTVAEAAGVDAVRSRGGGVQRSEVIEAVDAGSEPGPSNGTLVAVLADGMGGHVGGALASKTVCDHFIKNFTETDGATRERLVTALRLANDAVKGAAEDDPMLDGMGSTMIGTVFGEHGVEWVSVGDSPLMLFRRGEIAVLNEDHSLAPELDRLAEAGSITEQQAKLDPRRHMLRSAITGDEIELVDLSRNPLKLEAGDYVILASDGVHALEPSEIGRVVDAYGDDGARAVCDALIRAVEAVRDPHQDNATVIAVRLSTD